MTRTRPRSLARAGPLRDTAGDLGEAGRAIAGQIAWDSERHAFYPDRLDGVDVFKLENDRRGSIYLSERVVSAIEAAPLVGSGFRLVWTDE